MRRHSLAIWTSVLFLLAACSDGGGGGGVAGTALPEVSVSTPAPATTGDTEPAGESAGALPSVPEGYLRFIDETAGADPTPQQTLDWLVSATGLEIPGASAVYGDLVGEVGSLTAEINWLTLHWSSFTPEQQAALQAAFGRPAVSSARQARGRAEVVDDARSIVQELLPVVSRLTGVAIDPLAVSVREIPQVELDTALAGTNPASLREGVLPDEGLNWMGGESTGYCDIMVGSLFAAAGSAARRGALAHELSHCAVIQRYDYSPPRTPGWWDEGGAAYAGEVAVSDSAIPFGRNWWSLFFGGNKRDAAGHVLYSFTADEKGYSAIGLFAWAGEARGPEAMVREWVNRFADPNRLDWMLGGAVGSAPRGASLAAYAMAAVRQPWGPRWTMRGVNLANHGAAGTGRTLTPVSVAPNVSRAITLGAGRTDVAAAFRLDPGPSVDLLAVQLNGYGGVTAQGRGELVATGSPVTQVFCIGPACACREPIAGVTPVAIDRGVSPVVALAGDIGAAPVLGIQGYDLPDDGTCDPCPGAAAAGAVNRARADVGDDLLCEPPDSAPPVTEASGSDGCLVGTWHLDPNLQATEFRRAIAATGDTPPEYRVGGSYVVVFGSDGSLSFTATQWSLEGDEKGPPGLGSDEPVPFTVRFVVDGAVTGSYRSAGGVLTLINSAGNISGTVSITMMGQTVPMDVPADLLKLEPAATSSYTCSGSTLTLTPQVPNAIPIHLTR